MDRTSRLSGSALSLLGTLFQLVVVTAAIPELRYCLCMSTRPAPTLVEAVDTWRPFIENPGAEWEGGRSHLTCPEPRARGNTYHLPAAPLPDGYDPHAYGGRQVYACVLVGADGDVLGARMLRGTGRPSLDRQLLGTIRGSWRFRPAYPAEEPRSWQRIRLNSGPVDGSVWAPLQLY